MEKRIKDKAIAILEDILLILKNEEKIIELTSLEQRLLNLNVEDVISTVNKITFQNLIMGHDFAPDFSKILNNLEITQSEIRRTRSNIIFYGNLSTDEFWKKLENNLKDHNSLPSFERVKNVIIY